MTKLKSTLGKITRSGYIASKFYVNDDTVLILPYNNGESMISYNCKPLNLISDFNKINVHKLFEELY